MGRLDDTRVLRDGDPSAALDAICSMPGQLAQACEAVAGVRAPDRGSVGSVLVCGMGGSGVGGDAAAACASASGGVPVVVHKSYGAPAFAGPSTFVVASSYSGSTEETVDAARACIAAGAGGVAVACGGPLRDAAAEAGWPVVEPASGLMPRYALGWMAGATIATIGSVGALELPDGWAASAEAHLAERAAAWGPQAPTSDNVAKALAHELHDAFPVVWGGPGVSGAAATRWKTDINENAKTFAHAAQLPEADHHEIVAFAGEGRPGRPAVKRVLICLREHDEDPRVAARFRATTREVAGDFDLVWEYRATATDPATTFFELALLGGLVSAYAGILRGVDPTPIDSITRLKETLAGLG